MLIVDEAHHLRNDVLEELRILTNYEMDSLNRLCLLLVGQSELRRRLTMAVHKAIGQRIVVRYQLSGLTRDETGRYIEHLLRLASCEVPIFEPAAIEAVYQATSGLPRKVNLISHHALVAAGLEKTKAVTIEHVQVALTEVA